MLSLLSHNDNDQIAITANYLRLNSFVRALVYNTAIYMSLHNIGKINLVLVLVLLDLAVDRYRIGDLFSRIQNLRILWILEPWKLLSLKL